MYCLFDFCVVCWSKQDEYYKILRLNSDDAQLLYKLRTCGYVTDFLDINVSVNICNKCFDTLQVAYEFMDMCRKNSAVLRGYAVQLSNVSASTIRGEIGVTPKSDIKEEQNLEPEHKHMSSDLILKFATLKEQLAANLPSDSDILLDEVKGPIFEEVYIKEGLIDQNDIKEELIDECTTGQILNRNEILNTSYKHKYSESEKEFILNVDKLKDEIIDEDAIAEEEEHCTVKEEILAESRIEYLDMEHQDEVVSSTEKNTIKEQMQIHTGERRHQCTLCDKKFKYPSGLSLHKVLHTCEQKRQCPVCGKIFQQPYYLKTHMQIHTGERKYQCSVCEKRFATNGILTTHMLVHNREKKYQCTVCEKRFTRSDSLGVHMRIHTGERFHCSICEKQCTQFSNLKTHMRVHTGECKYECTVCEKRFVYSSSLTKHMRIHTGKNK